MIFLPSSVSISFANIDFRPRYQHMRLGDEDIKNMSFTIHYEHYEFMLMPFKLTNSLTGFMDQSMIVLIDDILVY